MIAARRLVLGSACALAALGRPAAAATVWRMVTEYPATAMPGEGLRRFAEEVARVSNGTLTIDAGFDAAGGIRSAAMIEAVATGRLDAADAFTGALAAEAPIFQLSALPFLTKDPADTARLLAAARPQYQAALSSKHLTLLYATPWPATGIWSRTALTEPSALAGLRIRTYDAASTAVFRGAGAAPVQISFADALPRLRTGEMDAVLSSGDGGAGARLWELLPHFTVLDYASPLSLAFCRTAALEALGGQDRTNVLAAASNTEAQQFQAIDTRLAENVARMEANGVRIGSPPAVRAALAQAAGSVIADWTQRAGPAGAAVLAAYKAREPGLGSGSNIGTRPR